MAAPLAWALSAPSRAGRAVALRPFEPADLTETVAMWHASKRAAFPYNAEQQRHTLDDDTKFFCDAVAPRCWVWLALDGDRIAGFVAVRGEWIDHLFVRTDLQRRGVGSALLAKAIALAPGGLRLFTFQRNAPARAFYEKHGFRAVAFGVSPPPESEPDVEYRRDPATR